MSASGLIALNLILGVAALPVLAASGYLGLLALAARATAVPLMGREPSLRLDVVVPAHDEESGVASTVESILSCDYRPELRRVIVVADNCSDRTAEEARIAGATVTLRCDAERRGKGFALEHAFRLVECDDWADAVVVVDADSVVSRSFLRACAARLAGGEQVVQADYLVRNPDASWRTRLMVVALALFHGLRSLGRERLGLSAGLRGNGMAFRRAVLCRVPYHAYSLVEDVEYGIALGEAGVRVCFAPEARVYGEMVASGDASGSQRRRWEHGRRALARRAAGRLFLSSLRRRSPMLFDLAADLTVPPLTTLVLAACAGFSAAMSRRLLLQPATTADASLLLWSLALAGLALYVARGCLVSGLGARGLVALAGAPLYAAWKVGLGLRRGEHGERPWTRTPREDRP